MTEWRERPFEDLFQEPLRNGLTKPSKIRGAGLRMVNMKEIFGYDLINDDTPMELVPVTEKEYSSFLRHNDLLFARQSLVESGAGKVSIFKGTQPTVFESHLIRCRINDSLADPNFVYYLFKSPIGKGTMLGIVQQTAAAGIRGSDLKTLVFKYPPLSEQKAIAFVLSSLDDKIDLLHKQNQTLEKMAETLFRQWFIEEAKEDWEEIEIGNMAYVNPTYSLKKDSSATYLEMKNVDTNSFHPKDWYKRGFTSGMKFQNGDTILARITPCLENGKTTYVTFLENGEIGWGSTEYIVIRMKAQFHPFISYIIAKDKDFRDYAINSMEGSSGRQRAQASVIKEFTLPLPPESVITELNKQLDEIVNKLVNNAKEIKTLEKLRDTLLPKLMSGEVSIKED